MLGLQLPTDPRWVNLAELTIGDILTDHAYCEQKAASQCISLIQRYPERKRLVNELAPVVTEEWGHFRMVLAEMRKRGIDPGRQRTDEYVVALERLRMKGGNENERLADRLLICGLIEARSCERFRLLSEGLSEPYLKLFYRHFMESEAGHYRLFLDLAREYSPEKQVRKQWQLWLNREAEILKQFSIRGDRMH